MTEVNSEGKDDAGDEESEWEYEYSETETEVISIS